VVLVWAKAVTPNALPSTSTGRPKVLPDFIMFLLSSGQRVSLCSGFDLP
jgi:hypothetical protein